MDATCAETGMDASCSCADDDDDDDNDDDDDGAVFFLRGCRKFPAQFNSIQY